MIDSLSYINYIAIYLLLPDFNHSTGAPSYTLNVKQDNTAAKVILNSSLSFILGERTNNMKLLERDSKIDSTVLYIET